MFSVWLRGSTDARIRARRSALAAAVLSIGIHALLLLVQIRPEPPPQVQTAGQEPLVVRLTRPSPPVLPAQPPVAASVPKPRAVRKPAPRKDSAIALTKPTPSSRPLPEPVAPQAAVPEMDMTTMLEAARERRRAAEDVAARANAEARVASREPSPDDIAMANIRRSLQSVKSDGASGIFEVLGKGARTGRFVFHGWTPGARNSTRQTFEVDAPDGDVERALVRKMIELIRKHYTGDFNWESHRLGRVIVKSARPEDSAELEEFLMREFFSEGANRSR